MITNGIWAVARFVRRLTRNNRGLANANDKSSHLTDALMVIGGIAAGGAAVAATLDTVDDGNAAATNARERVVAPINGQVTRTAAAKRPWQ